MTTPSSSSSGSLPRRWSAGSLHRAAVGFISIFIRRPRLLPEDRGTSPVAVASSSRRSCQDDVRPSSSSQVRSQVLQRLPLRQAQRSSLPSPSRRPVHLLALLRSRRRAKVIVGRLRCSRHVVPVVRTLPSLPYPRPPHGSPRGLLTWSPRRCSILLS